jgi:EmrB/QacA subfamily drug resistance transporter
MAENQDDSSLRMTALLVATIASFSTPFISAAINIALPAIGTEFHTDAILLSWIPTSFLLVAAMFAVPFGRIADIHGMKRIFTYGMIIFTIASLLSAIAPSAIALIIFRILQGVGSAMIFVTSLAIITSIFPPQERGKAIGINIAAVYFGLSMGPVLGGFLTYYFGWRSLFYILVPLGLLVIVLVQWKLKGEWAACRGEKFDFTGSILYSIMLVLIMYGFSTLPSILGILLVILGAVGLVAFIKWELRVDSPVLDMKLFFKNTTFAFANMAALLNYSATFAVTFLLSLYLQYIRGFAVQDAGFILVAQPILMVIVTPIAGRLSDKYDPRIIATIGMSIVTLGIFGFVFLSTTTSLEYIIISLIILGLGFGLFSSPNTNSIMGSVERRFYGVASATVSTMRLIGQTMSMGIALLIFALYIGRVEITPTQYPALLTSIQTAFIVFTILCFIGIFASFRRGKRTSNSEN